MYEESEQINVKSDIFAFKATGIIYIIKQDIRIYMLRIAGQTAGTIEQKKTWLSNLYLIGKSF